MTARYTHLNLNDLGGAIATLPPMPTIVDGKREQAAIQGEKNHSNLRPLLRPPIARTMRQKTAFSGTIHTLDKEADEMPKKEENPNKNWGFEHKLDGGPCRTRTCDQVIMSHLL